MAVGKGLDVDQNLLAHIDAPFHGGRAHVRQQQDIVQRKQFWINRRFVFEHVQSGTTDFARNQHPGQGVFINDLAARRVDDGGVGLQ